MSRQWKTYVLLGLGGESPGLAAYDVESDGTESILSLPPGHSVYAVGISPDGGRVVAGTKAGYLHLPADSPSIDEPHADRMGSLLQGAAVLSVCFVDDMHLAASDIAGRCLLWNLSDLARPVSLPVPRGGIVHGLFRLDGRSLAGLSTLGRIILWDWSRETVAQEIEAPHTPPILALVRPVYWSAANCWAWPARGGALTLFEWPDARCRRLKGHDGDFYGMSVAGRDLLTVGRTDGCLRRWTPSSKGPAESLTVPRGLISSATWQNGERRLVLVDEAGSAGVYSHHGDTIQRIRWLPGSSFRLAVGPDPVALSSHTRHRVEGVARTLVADIREQYAKGHLEDVDRLHGELRRIGYGHIGWALQAEEARRRDDMAGELRAYAGLLSLVPGDGAGLADSLARYARLLERIWQIKEAYAVWQRLHEIRSREAESAEALARLGSYIETVESHECVVACTDPLSVLVESAMVLHRPFMGRYVLGTAGPSVRCHGVISLTDVLERYQQVRGTAYEDALPVAEAKQFVWLSESTMEHIEAVVLPLEASWQVARPEYCLRIWRTESHTIFSPKIIVWADDQASGMTAIEHNQQISSLLRYIQESESYRAVARAIHECFKEVIARLLTRQLAMKVYERGNKYA